MYDLEQAITDRHSTRLFLRDKPVPTELVTESLELGVRAPSNSNVQPWHVVFASGPARDRLAKALLAQADTASPIVPPLPESFAHQRRELGALLYGTMGVPRDDKEARRIAVLRNWEFFGAPLTGIVCMHRDLDHVDALGVGMFLQTFLLALTARGLGSCVQVSVAGYPDVLREQLDISDDYRILCGVAIGYEDPDFAANSLNVPRNPLDHNFVFKTD
ncbi:oxidoreductase [Mycobacterium sp. CBMA 234]|uniref:nitroreductase n=1 Tax=Mycolicibacterium sp. CBMA 234 TaxID=1918495 RepID=UPI0012DE0AFD|nr:nitroreductase [Mycolicibacterium sp. CBMA 234]MUL66606.1 oxidoreductase [Mycolicibacterium sp. CBMA 234]